MVFAESSSIYNATSYAYTTQVTAGNATARRKLCDRFALSTIYNKNASITLNRNGADAETVAPISVTNCFPNPA